mgnify:CR=1 FL=1
MVSRPRWTGGYNGGMFRFTQYYGRLEGWRGGWMGLPGWARLLVGIAALPGILLGVLSILMFAVSVLALFLLALPVYRLVGGLRAVPVEQDVDVVTVSPGRRTIDATVIQ